MKRTFLRNALANIALAAASLCLSLVAAEFFFRWINQDAVFMMPRYVTDAQYNDFQIRRNVPDSKYSHTSPDGRWHYTINSQGFRDTRVFSYEKNPGRLRILTLGDSFTLGFEVGQQDSYSAVLERYLHKRGIDAEVINAGVSGFSNAEALVFLQQEGVRFNPDVVVLGFFSNDVGDNVRSGLYRLEGEGVAVASHRYLPAVRIRNFLNSFWIYRWLSENSYIHNYLNARATVIVRDYLAQSNRQAMDETLAQAGAPEPDYPERLARALVREIHATARGINARFVLMDIPTPELDPSFPIAGMDVARFADHFIAGVPLLAPYQGLISLYRPNGFRHWSEFAHFLAGVELGKVIIGGDLPVQ